MKKQRSNLLKRASALVLALMICVSMLQVSALAADGCSHENAKWEYMEGAKCCSLHCPDCDRILNTDNVGKECDVQTLTITPATCTTPGVCKDVCTKCGHIWRSDYSIDSLGGHLWDEGEVTKEPTYTTEGEKTFTCLRDPSHTEVEKLSKLMCNQIDDQLNHKIDVFVKTVEATCVDNGYHLYECGQCHETRKEVIPATGNHSWGAWTETQPITRTSPGEQTHECSVCGKKESEPICKQIDENGHHKVTEVKTDATCTGDGSVRYFCTACGFDETVITKDSALGHKFSSWKVIDAVQHHRVCERGDADKRGYEEFGTHDMTGEITKPATSTEPGIYTHWCKDNCGYRYTTPIPVEGCQHVDGDGDSTLHPIEREGAHQDATCTEAGYTDYKCSLCDEEIHAILPALGHDYGEWVDTDEENHTHTCQREGCTEETAGHSVEAAHVYDEDAWRETRPAAIGVEGEETNSCTECGHRVTRPIPAIIGPQPAPVPPTPPQEEPDEPLPEPDVPLDPTPDIPDEPDEPIDDPDVPLDPTPDIPDEPDEPVDDPDVPLDPTPDIPDEPDEPDEPIDEPDTPLAPEPELPEEPGDNGNGEEEIDDTDVPLSDVPKTGDVPADFFALLAAGCGLALIRTRKNAVK